MVLRVVAGLAAAALTPTWSCARQQMLKDAPGVNHRTILIPSLQENYFKDFFFGVSKARVITGGKKKRILKKMKC